MSKAHSQKHLIICQLRYEIQHYKSIGDAEMVIRLKAMIAYENGMDIKKIHKYFDVCIKTIKRWIKRYTNSGVDGLEPSKKSGRPANLNPSQLKELKAAMLEDNQRVWVARHVYVFLMTTFYVSHSINYIPEILKKINLSFHKAVHYLIKKNEDKRAEWIKEKLPEIYEEHIKNGWRIFYQDEVGFQTEGTLSYSWGEKGKPIPIKNKGRHGRVNLMGAYEVGSGEFFYMFTTMKVNALRFKRFLCCLKRKFRDDKIIIIADNASFHKAKWFRAWWESTDWLKMEFLPAYSPDFNPIERLWKWIKKEYTHNMCFASKAELKRHLIKKLALMTEDKSQYAGTMRTEMLRLKAAFDHHDMIFPWDSELPKVA
jgi:transposase